MALRPTPSPDPAAVIAEITPQISRFCRNYLPRWAREDAQQDCIVHLLEKCIHAKPERASLRTYLGTCARNFIVGERRKLRRQTPTTHPDDAPEPIAPETLHDREIEELAHLILSEPSAYLNSHFRAELLKAIVENPDAPRGAIADLLQVDVRKVWSTLYRVKEEITRALHAKCV